MISKLIVAVLLYGAVASTGTLNNAPGWILMTAVIGLIWALYRLWIWYQEPLEADSPEKAERERLKMLNPEYRARHDFNEALEERHANRSTLATIGCSALVAVVLFFGLWVVLGLGAHGTALWQEGPGGYVVDLFNR